MAENFEARITWLKWLKDLEFVIMIQCYVGSVHINDIRMLCVWSRVVLGNA
jgi:hypothetical protein